MMSSNFTVMPTMNQAIITMAVSKDDKYSLLGSADCEKQDNLTNDNSEQEGSNYYSSPHPGQSPKAMMISPCIPSEGLEIIL